MDWFQNNEYCSEPKSCKIERKKHYIGDIVNGYRLTANLGQVSHHRYYLFECPVCGGVFKKNNETLKSMSCPYCSDQNKTNHTYGGYKVILECEKRSKSRNRVWLCKCRNCGEMREISANKLCALDLPLCSCRKNSVSNIVSKEPVNDINKYISEIQETNRTIHEMREANLALLREIELTSNNINV